MNYQAQIINIPCDDEASLAANIGAGYTAYRKGHKQARHAAAEIAAQADARVAQLEKDRRCMGEIEDIHVANRDNLKARITELETMLTKAGVLRCDRCYAMTETERSGQLHFCGKCKEEARKER